MVARFLERRTLADFNDWTAAAQPGAQQVYGFGVSASTCAAPGVAQRMMQLADHQLVLLVQRRVIRPDGNPLYPFDYLAIRTARPTPAGWPTLMTLAAVQMNGARK